MVGEAEEMEIPCEELDKDLHADMRSSSSSLNNR